MSSDLKNQRQPSTSSSCNLSKSQSNRARQERHQISNSYSDTLNLEIDDYREHFTQPQYLTQETPIPLRFESDRVHQDDHSIELERYPSLTEIQQQNQASDFNQFTYPESENPSTQSFFPMSNHLPTNAGSTNSNGNTASNGSNGQGHSLYGQLRWSRQKAPMSWDRRKK